MSDIYVVMCKTLEENENINNSSAKDISCIVIDKNTKGFALYSYCLMMIIIIKTIIITIIIIIKKYIKIKIKNFWVVLLLLDNIK